MPVSPKWTRGEWSGGFAHWRDERERTAYLSIAFTYRLPEARRWAIYYGRLGYRVLAGGPALFTRKGYLDGFAETGGDFPDAIARHNPMATKASEGCPVGCNFCMVWMLHGRKFTLFPDFVVRPVLCDNNLSGLPVDYQEHIIRRYQVAGVPLLDANSGFEPQTFDDDCFHRWSAINQGPWRFAFDEQKERADVERVMKMLREVSPRRKRVYVIIGNEPVESCLDRIQSVIAWGGEPHVQPFMKLNTLTRKPYPRFDWTEQKLRDMARWANRMVWRKTPFEEYGRSVKTHRYRDRYSATEGLFI